MDPVIFGGLIELAKILLAGYFQALRIAGKTEEEINALYQEEMNKVRASDPGSLPEPE